MNNSKKMILFYVFLVIVSLIFTYIFEINSELKLFYINQVWVSSSFCFTIFSGVFTGSLVALVIEIRQYQLLKRNIITSLYQISINLYIQLTILKCNIDYYIQNDDKDIPECLGDRKSNYYLYILWNQLITIDYNVFCKKNIIYKSYQNILINRYNIDKKLNDLVYISKVVLEKRLINNRNMQIDKMVTSKDSIVKKVLEKEVNDINIVLQEIDILCKKMNKKFPSKFNWEEDKNYIKKIGNELVTQISIDNYINI